MNNFEEQYALWDEFLIVWPVSRLATMTLDEYTQAGSKDTFTYWIESKLDQLGSIWGGSAFKFGIFSRKNAEDKSSNAKLSYSETHGWYTSLGSSVEEAFERVRYSIEQVVRWAEQGDLESIDASKQLGEVVKWKIAFHYQNRQNPVIVPIFKSAWLACYLESTTNQSMAILQKAALAERPAGVGILEFGRQVWKIWDQKNLEIWKLSHGMNEFSDDELQNYLQAQLAVIHKDTPKRQGKKFQEAQKGALFYLCHSNVRIQLIGQFISESEPCNKGDGWIQRQYRILKKAIVDDSYLGGKKGWTPNYNSTFKQVTTGNLTEFESTLLKPFFGVDLAELVVLKNEPMNVADTINISKPITAPTLMPKAKHPVVQSFNRIYYGPPGTGKTYTLMKLLKRDYEKQVTSVSREEWEHQFIFENFSTLKWWEGVAAALYEQGGICSLKVLYEHPYIKAIQAAKFGLHASSRVRSTLQRHTIEESTHVKQKAMSTPFIFNKNNESDWCLAGEWEESCEEVIALVEQLKQGPQEINLIQNYSFVTFHQSYGYEEFVEGLRPILNGQDGEVSEVRYEIHSGIFKELCSKARQFPDQRFAMVIDEINRGNISKIFGELITLIEPDKRDPLNGDPPPLELTLAYSGKKFSVPTNVDIIGTMNTADRSLALLDTALRRRFDFVPLLPDTRSEKVVDDPYSAPLAGLYITEHDETIDVRRMLERINERIETLYDREHCIGHAYFIPLKFVADELTRFKMLAEIFCKRIVPLLEEYFFEDWHKIRLVLGDNQKSSADQFITERDIHEQDLNKLFGNDHGLDSYSTRRRYQIQSSAFINPNAYIGIYKPTI